MKIGVNLPDAIELEIRPTVGQGFLLAGRHLSGWSSSRRRSGRSCAHRVCQEQPDVRRADPRQRRGAWPYAAAARSLIDERDIAVRALTDDEHNGSTNVLSGPETLTQAEQVNAIGQAIGRPLRFEEVSPDQLWPTLVAALGDEAFADGALATWAGFVDRLERTTSTVQEVTGRPRTACANRPTTTPTTSANPPTRRDAAPRRTN